MTRIFCLVRANAKALSALAVGFAADVALRYGFELPTDIALPAGAFITAAIVWLVPNKDC